MSTPTPSNLPHPFSPQAILITFLLAIAAYIVTFRISTVIHIFMGLISVTGDYQDLFTLFPLPKTLLQSILPKDIFDGLMPVPASYGIPATEHLVMLHLGRQRTGPPFYKFGAQEAKVEIPFVAPPFSTSRAAAVPSVWKHSLWTDNTLLATSARMIMGLRTEKAVFDPPNAPSDEGNQRALKDSSAPGKYEVRGRVGWNGRKIDGAFVPEQYAAQAGALKTHEMWWFGEHASGTLCKFPFTHHRPAVPYKANIRLHLPSIAQGAKPLPLPGNESKALGLRENFRIEGEWLVLEGVTTWWTDAAYVLDGPHTVAAVEKGK
ncbi:hypothetical protein CALVIDRAFT_247524 [Calocera viscosa TUFC12733]|uniref:Uncharacterized protein n=1 Tax=Calocera viscosa (strain TUFC12733) TaxID=1330018 RepID=A0A167JKV1_CALVF|nr:hypothetical protein CALVIDRAFT_247524 [Calocera viscosa TUFC12733]